MHATRAIIVRPFTLIPTIKMAAKVDDFFRILQTHRTRNHVGTQTIRQCPTIEFDFNPMIWVDRANILQQIRHRCRHRHHRNFCHRVLIMRHPRMWMQITTIAHTSHQNSQGTIF